MIHTDDYVQLVALANRLREALKTAPTVTNQEAIDTWQLARIAINHAIKLLEDGLPF